MICIHLLYLKGAEEGLRKRVGEAGVGGGGLHRASFM